MNKNKISNLLVWLKIAIISFVLCSINLKADETTWIAIGDLRSWYSSAGCEIEIGRTGAIDTQQDGLQYPAQFRNQDTQAAKALWIGSTNFNDPIAGKTYPYKVVHVGPRLKDTDNEFIPQEFKLYGKYDHPLVVVDGLGATELDFLEVVELDPNLISDRMLYNEVNTSMGITMTRKIYAWSNQKHSNYFIYDYVFVNTGIYDKAGSTHNLTLTDVLFHWQYRYAIAKEACAYGVGEGWLPQSATWGHNTMNDQTRFSGVSGRTAAGLLPQRPDTDLRTLFSWCGNHSKWDGAGSMIGGPAYDADGHLGASQFVGTVVLYADDPSNIGEDDPNQPFTTMHLGSDDEYTQQNDQFNEAKMTGEYLTVMSAGHPDPIHADWVGQGNADETGGTPGGYSQTHTFGPYTMAPGDSVHIVLAEAVAGINRQLQYEVGKNWLDLVNGGSGLYTLPDGSTTTNDPEVYKNAWVFTGVDSLFQTFERAKDNYENNLSQGESIAQPPDPPSQFSVNSGGDRIVLTWANNSESSGHFAGYNIYRAIVKPDTTYELIKTINGAGTYEYFDLSPLRGTDYYYYITAFDDGFSGSVLESSKFYTMTSQPAFLKRPAGHNLSNIRIVPNPYNISARDLQFPGKAGEDRIMFYNIPKVCRIKIFTERGDLINTIEHVDGSGDQEWKQLTSSRQVVVSGLYIAHIEVLEDQYDDGGNLTLKKGDSVIKKFIIVR